jgi:hypothetical protein
VLFFFFSAAGTSDQGIGKPFVTPLVVVKMSMSNSQGGLLIVLELTKNGVVDYCTGMCCLFT